jgi:dephospho-CoA kinase
LKYVIGLTGRIASGKSNVSRMLEKKGAYIIDADKITHDVLKQDGPAYTGVINYFGSSYLDAAREIDRHKLGSYVFACESARIKLNELVHPYVIKKIEDLLASHEGVIVLDVVFLKESGLDGNCDEIWVLEASEEIRILRIMNRNQLSREAALERIRSQRKNDDEEYRAPVYRVDNGGSLSALTARIEALWKHVEAKCPNEKKVH